MRLDDSEPHNLREGRPPAMLPVLGKYASIFLFLKTFWFRAAEKSREYPEAATWYAFCLQLPRRVKRSFDSYLSGVAAFAMGESQGAAR